MKSKRIAVRLLRNWFTAFVDPRRILGITRLPRYFLEWRRFTRLADPGTVRWLESYPCLGDRVSHTPFDPHYFYQACWAARKLAGSNPTLHLDIGSSVMMIAVLSGIVPTVFVDYRPPRATAQGLIMMAADLLALPFSNGSVHSLSCLHVIEHIGLGRYGDDLDPKGSIKAAQELTRVLAPGGRLLLSTPVGQERIQFNAHRVFAPATVISIFNALEPVDFAMVNDKGKFSFHSNYEEALSCEYACGMFDFIKPN